MKKSTRIYNIAIITWVLLLLQREMIPDNTLQVIEGTVLSDATGKPVPKAFVYVVEGEEEVLTNDKGVFRIETTKNTPLVLTIQHWQFEKLRVAVHNAKAKLSIRLRLK
ncbi:MAG: carboxypeptidase-like regulatory domain-containing protein [Chitinophagaceae bacterium]|nr:carboxypeptidase-like regulatory domain-containing protein [Chitinophagaceae bacterium]